MNVPYFFFFNFQQLDRNVVLNFSARQVGRKMHLQTGRDLLVHTEEDNLKDGLERWAIEEYLNH